MGTFNLSKDELIQIIVGQEGGIRIHGRSSGGGGGTFVVRRSNMSLIVAGGGGGIRAVTSRHKGCDASTNTSGNPGYKSWSGAAMETVQQLVMVSRQVRVIIRKIIVTSPKSVFHNTHWTLIDSSAF